VYAILVRTTLVKSNLLTTLLEELVDFSNIANSNTANTLLEYYKGNYIINIKEGSTMLFSLLYNLLFKELEILYKYLIIAKRLS